MNYAERLKHPETKGHKGAPDSFLSAHNPHHSRIFTTVVAFILLTAVMAGGYIVYQKAPEIRLLFKDIFSTVSKAFQPDYSLKAADTILSRGNALRAKGRFEDAALAYQESFEMFGLKDDYLGQGNVYTEMGILSTRTGDYESAEEKFQQALGFFVWADDSNGEAYTLLNLAHLYYIQKQFKLARKYFLTSEQYYKQSDNKAGMGNASLGLANLHIATKQVRIAARYFAQAETFFKSAENKRGLVSVYNSLSRAFHSVGTKRAEAEATRYYQLAKTIELEADSKALPEFSIRNSLQWLVAAFDQHKEIYEGELNTKARQETERALQ